MPFEGRTWVDRAISSRILVPDLTEARERYRAFAAARGVEPRRAARVADVCRSSVELAPAIEWVDNHVWAGARAVTATDPGVRAWSPEHLFARVRIIEPL